ncbi:MAG: EAL domain-containing protein [Christensenellales bacterium]
MAEEKENLVDEQLNIPAADDGNPSSEDVACDEKDIPSEEEIISVSLDEMTDSGSLENYILPNDDDSEEKADERGVSGVFDVYGREIIADVFENRLRMSVNAVKVAYGSIKNELLSYGAKRRFDDKEEIFTLGEKTVATLYVEGDTLVVKTDGKKHTVKKDKKGQSYLKAYEAVKNCLSALGAVKDEKYVPTAYAERYAFNPEAVLRGQEDVPPDETDYTSEDYDPVEGELKRSPVDMITGNTEIEEQKVVLSELQQKVSDLKGAAAVSEPIVYFYNAALNDENNLAYVDVQQVLNDKFLGKMLPQMFFAIAERSERIVALNLLAVEHTAKVADGDPGRLYVTQASPVLLTKEESKAKLIEKSKTDNGNLCLAFDCAMLETLGEQGKAAIRELSENGVQIMIDNTENAGLKILTEYSVDFLRFDGRYYSAEDDRKTAHLDIVAGYAKTQGIPTCVLYASTVKETRYFLDHGIKIVEGDIVGVPVRIVDNAIRGAKRLPK